MRLILCLTLVPLFLCAGEQKHKSKPAALEIGGFKAQQNGDTVSFEGRIRNISGAAVRQVKLSFLLIGMDEKVVSRRSGALDADELSPDEETAFAFEMPWNPGAVWVKIEAKGPKGDEIKLSGEGPYRIE
jgi:hypothetical protein